MGYKKVMHMIKFTAVNIEVCPTVQHEVLCIISHCLGLG